MKYFVSVNQYAAAQLGDLDLVDCAIIDWLLVICNSKSEAIQKERIRGKTWIRYSHLLHDMPLLGFTTRESVRKRLNQLKDRKYISMERIGQRTYVEVLEKCEKLLVDNVWKSEQKPSTVVDSQAKLSTQVDGYNNNSLSKERKGSTEKLNPQGQNSGYAKYRAARERLEIKKQGG